MSFFATVSRWRRPFLLAMLVVSVLLSAGLVLCAGPVKTVLFLLSVAVVMTFVVLMVVASQLYHPARLVSPPGEFAEVASPAAVLAAAGVTVVGVSLIGDDVRDVASGRVVWWGDLGVAGLWIVIVAVQWHVALGPFGVRLRADGVFDRQPFGTLFVPWEALADTAPAVAARRNEVVLYYRRPDEVVRRGFWVNPQVLTPTTDAGYLADVINSRVATGNRY